jgi:RNA polymerase sigma factor (sigma-70 family)
MAPMPHSLPPELARLLAAHEPTAREAAWADFARIHTRLLMHVARSVGHDYDAAMDAYAVLLEGLEEDDYRRLRAFAADGRSKFTTWLVVVARRLCLDHVRHRYGRPSEQDPGVADAAAREARNARRRLVDLVAEAVDPNFLAASDATPDVELRARQLGEALAGVLQALPASDRLLLALRFEEDLSAREIAAMVGLPTPFHVYRRLNALLDDLRLRLRQRGVEDATP